MSLIDGITLIFQRSSEGFYEEGEWVDPTITSIPVTGSLQPFRSGNSRLRDGEKRMIEERGFSSEDALIFYAKTLVKTTNQKDQIKADFTTIKNQTYEVMAVKDWTSFDLSCNDLDHYEVILVRKDIPSQEP